MSCYPLHVSDDASSGHPEWPQPSRTWLGPFLFNCRTDFVALRQRSRSIAYLSDNDD
jgi:hypothetical protein